MEKILIIHPRKGFYRLTVCSNCKYIFSCDNCSSNLIAYKNSNKKLDLLCHHCQSYYSYPDKCPECGKNNILSKQGGIDNLEEILSKNIGFKIVNLSKNNINTKNISFLEGTFQKIIYLTTRIFDPSFEYKQYQKIIFINSQNLLVSPDYLTVEEVYKSLMDLFINVNDECQIYFDGANVDINILKYISTIETQYQNNIYNWYQNFLNLELINRQKFGFYPAKNLLLLTSHQKSSTKSVEILRKVNQNLLETKISSLKDLEISDIYPAKILKRKNFYSYHLLIKFPKNYINYKELYYIINRLQKLYHFQVRLNPRHLF